MEDTDITRADMAMDRTHTVMKTMEKKIKMTDIAMETVDTVRRADMAMETVDMVMETMDMAMETVDTEEVTDIQTIQAQLTVIKVIPRVTHPDPRTVQKATADTNDYLNQTSDF